jgi:hypothetical protein
MILNWAVGRLMATLHEVWTLIMPLHGDTNVTCVDRLSFMLHVAFSRKKSAVFRFKLSVPVFLKVTFRPGTPVHDAGRGRGGAHVQS